MTPDQLLGAALLGAAFLAAVRVLRRAARRGRPTPATAAPQPVRPLRPASVADLTIADVMCPDHGLAIVGAAEVTVRVTTTGYLQLAACPDCGHEVTTPIRDARAAELISAGARPELTARSPDPPYLGGP